MRPAMIVLALLLLAGNAFAEQALPGVEPSKPIVRPLPEDDSTLPANEDGSFTVGNTRVKISGSVTIDVGVGNGPKPR